MNIKELMIGDVVDFYHPQNPEEKIITRHRITEIFECGLVGISGHNNPVHADHLEPIRLTRNILESNGWSPVEGVCASILRHNGYNLSILNWAKPGVNLTIDKGGYGPNLVCMPIYYVHELQHALLLCGIEKEIVL